MLLAIDVGNTNIVFGVYDGNDRKFISRFSSSRERTADETAVMLASILEIHNLSTKNIDGCIISSVVPQITDHLAQGLRTLFGFAPMIVGPGMKTGLNIKIDNPAQLGSDLLVDSVAAIAKYEMPCIVIDMGTATTISVVGKNNDFLGGAILPGVALSLDALSSRAAQLPGISFTTPRHTIGRNTIECMQSGIVLGNASMLDGMIERFEEELGEKCSVVATGGLSEEICKHTKREIIYDPELLLDGLRILYNLNKEQRRK